MNRKRFLLSFLVIFIVSQAYEAVVHGGILGPTYESLKHLWRADMNSLLWLMWVSGIVTTFLLTYIFVKGYEGKGWMEGVRFGLLFGLFTSIPMSLGTYFMIAIPFSLAAIWFVFGMLEMVILGILLALIYKPRSTT